MPRLTSIQQIANNKVEVAKYELKPISTEPNILGAYAKLIEAYDRAGFLIEPNEYDTSIVCIYKGKSVKELSEDLGREQRSWDNSKKDYDLAWAASEGEEDEGHEDVQVWPSWRKNSVRYFAEAEGWDIPALVEKQAVEAWEAAKKV